MHVDTEKTFEYVVYAVRMKIPCIRRIQQISKSDFA